MSDKLTEPDLKDPDNPEWTKEDFAKAKPASKVHGAAIAGALVRKRGRPPKDDRKQQVTLRLSQDVLSAARKTGPGWQGRVDDVLRTALTGRSLSARELGEAISKSLKGSAPRSVKEGRSGALRSSSGRGSEKKRA